jgi:hypothetical protein
MKSIIEITELPPEHKYRGVQPAPGKFYFIDYVDAEQPEGSYFGIAKCVRVCDTGESGRKIYPPLYEFLHPRADGELTLSLFYASEVVMESKTP